MEHPKVGICVLWLIGVATAQTLQQSLTKPSPAVTVTPTDSRAQLEPVSRPHPLTDGAKNKTKRISSATSRPSRAIRPSGASQSFRTKS